MSIAYLPDSSVFNAVLRVAFPCSEEASRERQLMIEIENELRAELGPEVGPQLVLFAYLLRRVNR